MNNSKNQSLFPFSPVLVLALILMVFLSNDVILQKIKIFVNNIKGNELASNDYVKFINSQTGNYDNTASNGTFLNKAVSLPAVNLAENYNSVLADQTPPDDSKWIEINLTNQTLYTHEGNSITHAYLISSGLWGRTPTGTYRTYTKLRYTRMAGGSGADYYNLPNVPFTMYFYKGYGIHGTYWHNNFGHPMSHGCVNMRTSEAEVVYNWAPVGTKVVIHN